MENVFFIVGPTILVSYIYTTRIDTGPIQFESEPEHVCTNS